MAIKSLNYTQVVAKCDVSAVAKAMYVMYPTPLLKHLTKILNTQRRFSITRDKITHGLNKSRRVRINGQFFNKQATRSPRVEAGAK